MGWWQGAGRHAVAAGLLFACLLALPAPLPATEAGARVLRVGLYENSPKLGTGADGAPEGIFVDILAAIASHENWQLEYVPGTWQDGLARLADGRVDIMPDVARSPERDALYAFPHEPVLISWSQVYARDGGSIRSLLDLQGKRIATLAGSIQHDQFVWLLKDFHLQATLLPQPGLEVAFAAVRDGQADAVVTNRFFGERHAAQYALADTGVVFGPAELHFATPPGSDPAIRDALDRNLRALKNDAGSAYYRALRHWTAHGTEPLLPAWLWWVAAGIIGLLLLGAVWIGMLRRNALRLRAADTLQRRLLVELANAKAVAEAADQAKSAFVATMAHELRTPLSAIMGFTELMLLPGSDPLTDRQRMQLGTVRTSADHLLALINDTLDITRIETNQLPLAREAVDVEASITKVAEILQPLADARRLRLEIRIARPLGTIVADARRLEQILLNLLGNAVKFTAQGSVTLQAERRTDSDGVATLLVHVRDTGPGIPPADLPRLFQPFSQLRSTAAHSAKGTGLGLAISKSLAEMMGGSISVDSQPGVGSTFTLTLPVAGAAPAPRQPG